MKKLAPLLFLVFAFACQKSIEPVTPVTPPATQPVIPPITQPVPFAGTVYTTMGTYDTFGKPSYLAIPDVISSNLRSFISSTLPEGKDLRLTQPALFSNTAIADLTLTKKSDISITFVSQSAGLANAFAYYTYPTSKPPATAKDIEKITYIFPNAGNGTKLKTGDKVNIGTFDVGTSVGFVIVQKGWNKTTKTIDNEGVHFCSNDVLNPETDPALKKHAVLIDYPAESKLLISFEDVNRMDPTCNHDFNDIVFYATVLPK